MNTINPALQLDGYKTSHIKQYPKNTQFIYSNLTPRGSRVKGQDYVVFFGLQYFIKEYLINQWQSNFFDKPKDVVVKEYSRLLKNYLGNEVDVSHIEQLHDLGYLPIEIRALAEGTKCPLRVPMFTITNTHPDFFWLTNYLETIISTIVWLPTTSATTAHIYRKVFDKYAEETGSNKDFVQWQGHDFSMRGMTSLEAACTSGAAHLLSFTGTDTVPAIPFLEKYYNANSDTELVGGSVPASEHAVMCIGSVENGEFDLYKRLITEVYPDGIVSLVSDTWDYWGVVTDFLPKLKQDILHRNGKLVIRPDSGDPVKIIIGEIYKDYTSECKTLDIAISYAQEDLLDQVREETPHGEHGKTNPTTIFKYKDQYYKLTLDIFWNRHDKQYYYMDGDSIKECIEIELSPEQKGSIECLWEIFGGKVNDKGFKELDPHIGLIYGDSITPERQLQIMEGLKRKGFASSSVVLGIGSFTYQYVTRDTYGFAIKATYGVVDNVPYNIFKEPKTDNGLKKSAKGLLSVVIENDKLTLKEECSQEDMAVSQLKSVFKNGKLLVDHTLQEIRDRLYGK